MGLHKPEEVLLRADVRAACFVKAIIETLDRIAWGLRAISHGPQTVLRVNMVCTVNVTDRQRKELAQRMLGSLERR